MPWVAAPVTTDTKCRWICFTMDLDGACVTLGLPRVTSAQIFDDAKKNGRSFSSSHVFGPTCSQATVFEDCGVSTMITRAVSGHSVTVFAYGQVGAALGGCRTVVRHVFFLPHRSPLLLPCCRRGARPVAGKRTRCLDTPQASALVGAGPPGAHFGGRLRTLSRPGGRRRFRVCAIVCRREQKATA